MSSYGTSKKEGSELGSQSQKKDAKLINLPGVSYIPDKLEIAEHPDLVQKVEAEFVDFLACLKDILKILYTLKTKHLRAMTPMPHEVLREIKIEKGPLFKAYDKALGGHITGISLSADTLFKRGMSVASSITRFKSAK